MNSLDGEAYCIYPLDMDSGSDLTAAAYGVPGFGFLYFWPPALIFSLGTMTRTTTYPFITYISFPLDWGMDGSVLAFEVGPTPRL